MNDHSLDDLRQSTQSNTETIDFEAEELLLMAEQQREARDERLFLGLRPVERMMLSIFLFMNVSVLMLAFLLATGRIVF